MARPRKSSSQRKFTPGQASYVLERLIGDRRVSWSDVQRYMNDIGREIGALEQRLKSLRDATGGAIRGAIQALTPGRPGRRRRGRPPGSGAAEGATKRRRRRTRVTAEQKASQQLQGRYLGLIREIPASRRAQYQKIAKDKGREAAIKELRSALNK